MPGKISGAGLASVAAGTLFLYAGIKGKSISKSLQAVISGKSPASTSTANPIYGGSVTSSEPGALQQELSTGKLPAGGGSSANAALGKLLASGYGWATGQNWKALNYGWGTLESGWNDQATNPGSGAFGIAQALGHGTGSTQGTITNEYGPVSGMSFPNSLYVAANSGNPAAQIRWGLKYISLTYGAPENVPGWLGQPGYGGY